MQPDMEFESLVSRSLIFCQRTEVILKIHSKAFFLRPTSSSKAGAAFLPMAKTCACTTYIYIFDGFMQKSMFENNVQVIWLTLFSLLRQNSVPSSRYFRWL